MKADIHPKLYEITITCACGASLKTLSTVPAMTVEICSNCHPFFTGKQKVMDTAGRIERFTKKYERAKEQQEQQEAAKKAQKKVKKQ